MSVDPKKYDSSLKRAHKKKKWLIRNGSRKKQNTIVPIPKEVVLLSTGDLIRRRSGLVSPPGFERATRQLTESKHNGKTFS